MHGHIGSPVEVELWRRRTEAAACAAAAEMATHNVRAAAIVGAAPPKARTFDLHACVEVGIPTERGQRASVGRVHLRLYGVLIWFNARRRPETTLFAKPT